MKKITAMVVAAFLATVSANAQVGDLKNEISVSYGFGVSTIGDGIGNLLPDALSGMSGIEHDRSRFGNIGVEYFRHLDYPRLAVGGIVTYAQMNDDMKNRNGEKVGEGKNTYISIMPSVKYYWVNKNYFGLYSKAAVGVMLTHDSDKVYGDSQSDKSNDEVRFMGQASPIGLEAGSQNFRVFCELGVGEQGIVLAGLRCKF